MSRPSPVRRARRGGFAVACRLMVTSLAAVAAAGAQEPQEAGAKAPKPYEAPPLFTDSTPLEITVTASFRQLRRDRTGTTPYRAGRVSYASDSGIVSLPVRLRTRGIWRRRNCEMPPLLMNFTKDSTKKSAFARLDRVRLSPHCRDSEDFEQYVLQEYQLYRVQRLLTALSFDVRLARVTYLDVEKKDTVAQRWAFLQEMDEAFAARVGMTLITQTGAAPSDLDPYASAFTGVFQYFVANTDFSIRELHNIVLLQKGDMYIPVARDFDWSGAVNARYAVPSPQLSIKYVTQRVMRGYCATPLDFEKVFSLFREKKDAIYALYADSIGTLLKPRVVKTTLEYFDEFYRTIDDPRDARKNIIEACLGGAA